ncbi:MAG: glycerophosphodiester phosphodiesterase [Anaerolineae bacterium]
MPQDALLAQLLSSPQDEALRDLAYHYAPCIRFDTHEPFLPLAAGYTVFTQDDPSPSYTKGRTIHLAPSGEAPAATAIEYAIWWDWDIGHLYELEHVWVYIDERGQVVRGEASWHGDYRDMRHNGALAVEDGHLVVYSEPGKHAFAPTPQWFRQRWAEMKRLPTTDLAGLGGVLVARYFRGQIQKTPLADRLVCTYLTHHGFEPAWEFGQRFCFERDQLVPWPALRAWIPRRVNAWIDQLSHEIPPSEFRFLRVGHRGARAHAPDNTLVGFRKAAELGADMVELDVQRTADGQLAVVHDAALRDGQGRLWPVQRSTMAQLRQIDLGDGQRVPSLSEALQVCADEQLGAYIEVKDGAVVPDMVRVLRDDGWFDRCLIGSFRPDWLAEVKALAPETTTSVLFGSIHVDPVALAKSVDATYVHPCWERLAHPSEQLTPDWIARVRSAGLGIVIWHEERPDEIAALCQLGVDAICSDAPELLL